MSFNPDYVGATVRPSPNHGPRVGKGEAGPDMIILHYTGMPTEEGAIDWLCRPESEVSAHYVVRENGEVLQLVPERRRAWHAGKSFWAGETDINSRSIGIEVANAGHPGGLPPFPGVQIASVVELCRDCVARWAIPAERVLAHSDVAPVRKVDPGERFPWDILHAAGIGHWVEPVAVAGGRFFHQGDCGPPVEALQTMLSVYGYRTEITGEFSEAMRGDIEAFQRHFRPAQVDGVADASTIETLHRLLVSLPRYA